MISSLRVDESSRTVQHQNSANPTDIVDLCTSGLEVYFLHDRWQIQSLLRRNVKTNFAALQFCPFFYEYPKKYWNCFFLLLSSNIAPWVWSEWTNMCLNIVRQKIKKWWIFFACLNEAFWLVTMKQQVCSILIWLSPM